MSKVVDRSEQGIAKLGLGCWFFGEFSRPDQDDIESILAIRSALAHGITHFDTSQSYGGGHSEAILGVALRGVTRPGLAQEVIVGTKISCVDKNRTLQAVMDSRARLNRDTIDIFYIHWPREGCSLPDMMEGLETARERGWIRRIGVSNLSIQQMESVMRVGTIDVHQMCYNLLWRHPERELLPFCIENDIAVVTYSSIAQGILTDKTKVVPRYPSYDNRQRTVYYDEPVWPHVYKAVSELKQVALRAGMALSDLAILWVMSRSGVETVLVGARNRAQVESNASVLAVKVDDQTLAEMTDISNRAMAHIPDVGNIFKHYQ